MGLSESKMSDEYSAKNDDRRIRRERKKYAPEGSASRQVKREELSKNYQKISDKIWKKINQKK